jgi:transcriptional regulator with XRE-family HTH domain
MILLRRLLGDVLRRQRQRQGRTLREVSAAARVSLGYLSEVERGQKEASSELLSAICDALDVRMSEVMREVSDELSLAELAAMAALRGRPAASGAGARAVAGAGRPDELDHSQGRGCGRRRCLTSPCSRGAERRSHPCTGRPKAGPRAE